jgi:hypothetical protein
MTTGIVTYDRAAQIKADKDKIQLGNCKGCGGLLHVQQILRLAPNSNPDAEPIGLDTEGKPLRQDPLTGRLSGKPQFDWVVCCSDCGVQPKPPHPYQAVLDAAVTAQKPTAKPGFMAEHAVSYVSANEMEETMQKRAALVGKPVDNDRLTAIETRLNSLEQKLEALLLELG